MSLGIILAGILGAGLGCFIAFSCSPYKRLAIAGAIAVPQFILPGLPESTSVFQLWVLLMALAPGWERAGLRSIYAKLLILLAILSALAALWSPLPVIAMINAAQIASLAILAAYAAALFKENPDGMAKIFGWLGAGVVVQSLLVILFRLRPDVEMSFLRSAVGRILIGTEKLGNFFGGSPDNVFDVTKSGGVWVNANTASMFLGVAACAFVAAAIRFQKNPFFLVALIAASAVVPTGSKSGLTLLLMMPLIGLLVPLLARGSGRLWIPPVIAIAYPAFLLFKHILDERIPESLVSDSASSLGTRGVIWEAAGTLFVQNPFLGLGFGGWGEYFYWASGGALGRTYPPHNIFIAAWSDMGTVAAVVLVVFVAAVLLAHIRLTSQTPKRESFAWGFGLAAFLWLFIHGMADAVTFYGDLRTMLIPALLLGLLMAQSRQGVAPSPDSNLSSLPAGAST
ncbi:O-antigen ligase family protein [Arthrobacter sp. zg-Y769]|uniref:O-antigen ligase family protein n=1 Tax=Arthrobacter sp. zg-Y769 TaxID=2894191 RepID=UPI001E3D0920|nr:O-antigen ligase family protein [Arthrobacter sp. zg-Y769]MCC9205343.1 hypothetical protein [Arthrobacter sp. zg-Y769]